MVTAPAFSFDSTAVWAGVGDWARIVLGARKEVAMGAAARANHNHSVTIELFLVYPIRTRASRLAEIELTSFPSRKIRLNIAAIPRIVNGNEPGREQL